MKGCCWITRIHRDSWPPEEKNSIRGQRRGLNAQSFCVIKFYWSIKEIEKASDIGIRRGQKEYPCISFSWGWSCSLSSVECHEPLSVVLQALWLSDLIPWIYFSLPLYSHKGFDLGHTCEWSSGFPHFLQFKSEFGNKEFMIGATVSSRSCFCWHTLLHLWLQRT